MVNGHVESGAGFLPVDEGWFRTLSSGGFQRASESRSERLVMCGQDGPGHDFSR